MSLGGLALAILAPSTAFGEIPKVGSSCPSKWRSSGVAYCVKSSPWALDAIPKIGRSCPSYWRSSAGAYCVKSSPASPDAIPKIWRSCPSSWTASAGAYCLKTEWSLTQFNLWNTNLIEIRKQYFWGLRSSVSFKLRGISGERWGVFVVWWRQGGSNSWPQRCQRCALPAELCPHVELGRNLMSRSILWVASPRGFEPLLPPWKGDVLGL